MFILKWLVRVLALAAAAVSGYLLALSISGRGLPAGCGAGSGCAEVLTSRWSAIGPLPVSGLALLVYAAVLAATWLVEPSRTAPTRRRGWSILIVLAAAIVAVAAWFTSLQLFVLQAVCPWCMADHALGLLSATLIGVWFVREQTAILANRQPDESGEAGAAERAAPRGGAALALAAGGLLLAAVLAASQFALPYRGPGIARLPEGENADTGPGSNRRIAVLQGKLQLAPHDEPTLGSPDAAKLLVVLFDYCCPHCRATHEYLLDGLPRHDQQLGMVVLPMPLDADCNPQVDETEPRFEHACELARLALAVWRADAAAFPAFDAWLFEPEMPREADEARRKAEQLVGAGPLERALDDPAIEQRIRRNVEAYAQSGADRIPVLMSPGFAAVVGRPESAEALWDLLERELQLQ